MYFDLSLFATTSKLTQKRSITFPNDTKKIVNITGTIFLSPKLKLKEILYTPKFKYNLLLVRKLTKISLFSVHFYHSFCVIQDLSDLWSSDYWNLHEGLYRLDRKPSHNYLLYQHKMYQVTYMPIEYLWHSRLGHPSTTKLSIFPISV